MIVDLPPPLAMASNMDWSIAACYLGMPCIAILGSAMSAVSAGRETAWARDYARSLHLSDILVGRQDGDSALCGHARHVMAP